MLASSRQLPRRRGGNAVRLLTIHAAKGLEFKVVVVADAGRDKAPPSPDEILALSDGRFGFRVVDPLTTKRRGAFDYDEVREARRVEEQAEKLRLYYVAMTRAKERLIVSGSIDREKAADASTPIGWVLGRLDADEELAAAGDAPLEIERNAARLVVRVDRHDESAWIDAPADADDPGVLLDGAGQLALFTAIEEIAPLPAAPQLPALIAPPEPPLHRVRRLSFTALSTFDQCSYKYYAIRVAGMRERRPDRGAGGEAGGLRATEIGDAVHKLLEQVDLAAPAIPDVEQVRELVPERQRLRARPDSRLRRVVLRVGSRGAHRAASPSREGTPLHVPAGRGTPARLSRRTASRRHTGARARLQDEPDRRLVA